MKQELRLTNANVKKVVIPAEGRITYHDTKIPGLQLRVSAAGTKSFCVRGDIEGKTIRVTIGRFPKMSADQAERKAKEFIGEIGNRVNPNARRKADIQKKTTLKQCLDHYLESRSNLKESSVEQYERYLNKYLSDWLDKPLLKITRDKVERRHKEIGKKSNTSANATMRVLRALMEYAHGKYEDQNGDPIILHNPVKRLTHVKAWYKETRRSTYIKSTEIKPWYEAVTTMPDWSGSPTPELIRDYLLLVLFTGLRRNEASGLVWDQIDLKHNLLTVLDTKNGHPHVLPLSSYLVDLLKQRKKLTKKSKYVFPSGESSHLIDPKKSVANVREKSGVHFTIHDLRRTFITVAESLGIRDYTLKRLLNHRSSGDVTDGYIMTDVERLREPMQQISDRLLLLSIQKENVVALQINAKSR